LPLHIEIYLADTLTNWKTD